jgi:hypothetical protein
MIAGASAPGGPLEQLAHWLTGRNAASSGPRSASRTTLAVPALANVPLKSQIPGFSVVSSLLGGEAPVYGPGLGAPLTVPAQGASSGVGLRVDALA